MVIFITVSESRNRIEDFVNSAKKIGYKDRTIKEMSWVISRLLSSMDPLSVLSEENVLDCIHSLGIHKMSHSRFIFFNGSCKKFLNYLYHDDMNYRQETTDDPVIKEIIQGSDFERFIGKSASCNCQSTRKRKIKIISKFLQSLAFSGTKTMDDVSFDVIVDLYNTLTIEEKHIISSYLHYLFSTGTLPFDFSLLLHIEKRPKKIPSVYSQEEIKEIIGQIDPDSAVASRNKAILLLAAKYGLRSCDIVNLKYDDFDFEKGNLEFVQKKTGIKVSTVIDRELIGYLKDYISSKRPNNNSEYIFLNENAPFNHMDTGIIRYMMKKYIQKAQIKTGNRKKGPHAFRSSLASAMIENDIPYETVKKKLGHQSLNSITSYVKVSTEKLRQCALPTIIESGDFARWLNEECI